MREKTSRTDTLINNYKLEWTPLCLQYYIAQVSEQLLSLIFVTVHCVHSWIGENVHLKLPGSMVGLIIIQLVKMKKISVQQCRACKLVYLLLLRPAAGWNEFVAVQ